MLPHYHIRVNSEMKADLNTWKKFLMEPTVYCRPFIDFSKKLYADDLDWYTDSSGKIGYRGIHDKSYFFGTWPESLLKKKPSIGYLELYAVTVSVLLWLKRHPNRRICLYVDNECVMNWINNTSAGCPHAMILIRMIVLESLWWNTRVFARNG